MHKLMILSTVVLLASTSDVLADADADPLQPTNHGAVSGAAENDAEACDLRVPADPWVGVGDECVASGASPTRPTPVDLTAARINPHETAATRPTPANETAARINPHETAATRPTPANETAARTNPHETAPIQSMLENRASLPVDTQ